MSLGAAGAALILTGLAPNAPDEEVGDADRYLDAVPLQTLTPVELADVLRHEVELLMREQDTFVPPLSGLTTEHDSIWHSKSGSDLGVVEVVGVDDSGASDSSDVCKSDDSSGIMVVDDSSMTVPSLNRRGAQRIARRLVCWHNRCIREVNARITGGSLL